ncbi:putative ferric-chelate reductase 1 homolog isoform X2 [Folsomia candida]|uniref:putative ferric-chelate reductase 1 homolog isoform X2 n=1 Tax=Folsomia candida TaxID=158441 RepID=UPI001604FF78|nr:putative ferric-chelate reductase 1 homolog isoform X2 [Folsomia candida]
MLVTFGDAPAEGEDLVLEKELILEMFKPSVDKWLAIALSESDNMGPAYVVECVIEKDRVNLYHSFNVEKQRRNGRMRGNYSHNGVVKLLRYQRRNIGLYCRFSIKRHIFVRDPNVTKKVHSYDLVRVPYFLLYAWGNAVTEDGITGNLLKHTDFRASSKKIAIGTRLSPLPEQKALLRLHSTFLIAAVLFFLSLGMFSGRYYKETCVNVKIFIFPLWLVVHAISMTAMIALLVVALVVEIIAHQGWTAVTPPNFHSYVGCMAYDLSFVVYGMGFFVKPSQYGSSNIPAAVHVVGGNLVYFLCFVLIILADRVSFSGLACHIKWIVGAWGIIYCVFQCFFTKKRGRWFFPIPAIYASDDSGSQTRLGNNDERGFKPNLEPEKGQDPVEAPGSKIRLGAFVVICILAAIYTTGSIFLVLRNKNGHGDCFTLHETFEFSKK